MKFKDLSIGQKFIFEGEVKYPTSGIAHGPWIKTGSRTYVHVEDPSIVHKVGSINATVFIKNAPKKNAGPGGFTFHGSYTSQLLARKKEKEIPGSFIIKRGDRYYVLKPKRIPSRGVTLSNRHKPIRKSKNPRGGTIIYRDITRIEGTKGKDSQYAGQKFFHNFKRPYPEMIGLPDGSLLIRPKRGSR